MLTSCIKHNQLRFVVYIKCRTWLSFIHAAVICNTTFRLRKLVYISHRNQLFSYVCYLQCINNQLVG